MRRLTLSTKLLAAMLPLIVAVTALLAIMVRNDLKTIGDAENAARLGEMWDPLAEALDAIEAERAMSLGFDAYTADEMDAARQTTDIALVAIRAFSDELGSSAAAEEHVASARQQVSAARRGIDLGDNAPDMQEGIDPVTGYELAAAEVVAVGQLLPAEAGDGELGRELLSVAELGEARLSASRIIFGTEAYARTGDRGALLQARAAFTDMEASLSEFAATAPVEWLVQFEQAGFADIIAGFRAELSNATRTSADGTAVSFDTTGFVELVEQGVGFQRQISQSIVADAADDVSSARQATMIRMIAVLVAVLVAALIAALITRSITRRIRDIASGANQVAEQQLPALVEALSDERGNAVLPDIEPLSTKGTDELTELAQSFNSLQSTLVDVAREQVDVLRRGVSDIFVTMARRNRSLIDRQLAMLDEYEAEIDDPEILANYYQLDHLATRMRRNSESLLVLANAEPKRRRVKATEIDDVVRASISEVEDYKRIQIEALESLQVRGNVVADVSHLLAELFDNATSFSPPGSPVRVGGRRIGDHYVLRIVDDGVGIVEDRMDELNTLLREPPVIGLTASTTLGMSVVSLLAAKHGVSVTLAPGNPGVTVDVVLPSSLFGPIEETFGDQPPAGQATLTGPAILDAPAGPQPAPAQPTDAPTPGVAAYDVVAGPPADMPAAAPVSPTLDVGSRKPNYDILKTPEPAAEMPADPDDADVSLEHADATDPGDADTHAGGSVDPYDPSFDDAPRVVASSPTSLSSSLSAFRSGMDSAATEPDTDQSTTADADPYALPVEPAAEPADADPYALPVEPAATSVPAEPFAGEMPVTAPDLPPPPPAPSAEFSVPPAPPMAPTGPSSQPVAPSTARPAPRIDVSPDADPLPTRAPGAQSDVGGPDRISEGLTAASEPSALSAALAAFDTPQQQSGGELPSRAPDDQPMNVEDPASVAQSRLDPEALRERLRSFQTGRDGDNPTSNHPDHHLDLGGDQR